MSISLISLTVTCIYGVQFCVCVYKLLTDKFKTKVECVCNFIPLFWTLFIIGYVVRFFVLLVNKFKRLG